MKQFFISFLMVLAALLLCLKVSAIEPGGSIVSRLDSTPGVTVVMPDALASRLTKSTAVPASAASAANTPTASRTATSRGVFRVEVFADNSRQAKAQATAKRRSVQGRFPQYPVSLAFESPFWRVRVGEFRSRSDAEAAMAEIRQAFPSYTPYLRIVNK